MRPILKIALLIMALFGAAALSASASIIWTYDFPGTPGSPLGSGQTNPQTPNATFGDWNRVNISAVGTADVFDSNYWNTTSMFDSTQYASFTITAAAGYHLDLALLTFDEMRASGGPTKGLVQMFINGSATVYDSLSYNPSSTVQNKTFSFTPTVDSDNVTTVEFRFYGWNGGTPDASLILDNVAVTVGIVPEASPLKPVALLLASACATSAVARRRRSAC